MQRFPVFAQLYLRANPSFEKKKTSIKQMTKPISLLQCGSKIQQIWGQVVCLYLFDLCYCRNIYTALQIATETADCCCCCYYCYLQSHELIRSRQLTGGPRTSGKSIRLPSSSGHKNHKTQMLRDDGNRNKPKDSEQQSPNFYWIQNTTFRVSNLTLHRYPFTVTQLWPNLFWPTIFCPASPALMTFPPHLADGKVNPLTWWTSRPPRVKSRVCQWIHQQAEKTIPSFCMPFRGRPCTASLVPT